MLSVHYFLVSFVIQRSKMLCRNTTSMLFCFLPNTHKYYRKVFFLHIVQINIYFVFLQMDCLINNKRKTL